MAERLVKRTVTETEEFMDIVQEPEPQAPEHEPAPQREQVADPDLADPRPRAQPRQRR